MTYRTTVLPNGRIDADSLPNLPPGTPVEINVPKTVESLNAMLEEFARIGREFSRETYTGLYDRDVIYEDRD